MTYSRACLSLFHQSFQHSWRLLRGFCAFPRLCSVTGVNGCDSSSESRIMPNWFASLIALILPYFPLPVSMLLYMVLEFAIFEYTSRLAELRPEIDAGGYSRIDGWRISLPSCYTGDEPITTPMTILVALHAVAWVPYLACSMKPMGRRAIKLTTRDTPQL